MATEIDTTKKITIGRKGGYREGAGRKPSGSTNVNNFKRVTINFRPSEFEAIKRLAKENGMSLRALIVWKVLGEQADYARGYERD